MNYIQLIATVCETGKYLNWYCTLMSRGRQRAKQSCTLQPYERHHIVPRSFHMGGGKDVENIALLTPREHFVAHVLLTKCTHGSLKYKMLHAVQRFAGSASLTSWEYQRAALSTKHLPKGEEHRKRISEGLTGKVRSEEHKRNLSISNAGKPGLVGENNPMYRKTGPLHHNYGKPGPMTGKRHTEETKALMRRSHHHLTPMLGKKHTHKTKALMSLNNAMKVDPYLSARVRWTAEERENQRAKMSGAGNPNSKQWKITNVDTGAVIVVLDLKLLCKERGWSYKSLMTMRGAGKPYKRHLIETLSDQTPS